MNGSWGHRSQMVGFLPDSTRGWEDDLSSYWSNGNTGDHHLLYELRSNLCCV